MAKSYDGLGLQALAEKLGVQPTTAYNLAKTLTARGYLEKSRQPIRYHLGPALFAVVAQHARCGLRRALAQAVQRLAQRLPEAAIIATLPENGDLSVLWRMSPDRPSLLQTPEEMVLSPYVSASSLAFLAWATAGERQAFDSRYPFEEYGAHVWRTPERLAEVLEATRGRGYAERLDENTGSCRLAAPVCVTPDRMIALLGLSAPFKSAKQKLKLIDELLREIREVGRVWGEPPRPDPAAGMLRQLSSWTAHLDWR